MTGTLWSELIIASGICSIPARLLRTRKGEGTMKVVAFITEYAVEDRIIDHLKLTFYKCRSRRVIDFAVRPAI